MTTYRIVSVWIVILLAVAGYFVYASQSPQSAFGHWPFQLGLDLQGGTQLTYQADTSEVEEGRVDDHMQALRDVVRRRVTSQEVAGALGVTDPIVQTETAGFGDEQEHRLIVELPGVTNIEAATNMIGKTPTLEFMLARSNAPQTIDRTATNTQQYFTATGLTGRFVESAQMRFGSGGGVSNEPVVLVNFNDEGQERFAEITSQNVRRRLGIFLDGELLSAPVVREEIPDGQAQISGNFTPESARELVRNLNLGALPLPIELINTQSIGPSLGADVLDAGVRAGVIGLIIVAGFMLLWYRLPGLLAVVALAGYVTIMLALFKVLGVTITASGIAGFILSIGMAVDANILIFERMKEELRSGRGLVESIRTGFSRAWPSIRDANISSMITAVVLFYAFGQTFVRGFAVTFFLGVLVSMITAIAVTRVFLVAFSKEDAGETLKTAYGTGIRKY